MVLSLADLQLSRKLAAFFVTTYTDFTDEGYRRAWAELFPGHRPAWILSGGQTNNFAAGVVDGRIVLCQSPVNLFRDWSRLVNGAANPVLTSGLFLSNGFLYSEMRPARNVLEILLGQERRKGNVNPDILLSGFSGGAGQSNILGAILQGSGYTGKVKLITFAGPRSTDFRGVELVNRWRPLNWSIWTDPVCHFPFFASETRRLERDRVEQAKLFALYAVTRVNRLFATETFKDPKRFWVDTDGTEKDTSGQPFLALEVHHHFVTEYAARLERALPQEERDLTMFIDSAVFVNFIAQVRRQSGLLGIGHAFRSWQIERMVDLAHNSRNLSAFRRALPGAILFNRNPTGIQMFDQEDGQTQLALARRLLADATARFADRREQEEDFDYSERDERRTRETEGPRFTGDIPMGPTDIPMVRRERRDEFEPQTEEDVFGPPPDRRPDQLSSREMFQRGFPPVVDANPPPGALPSGEQGAGVEDLPIVVRTPFRHQKTRVPRTYRAVVTRGMPGEHIVSVADFTLGVWRRRKSAHGVAVRWNALMSSLGTASELQLNTMLQAFRETIQEGAGEQGEANHFEPPYMGRIVVEE